MKKTKTNRKILSIFSAILGVVFAFIVGITFCSNSLNLKYGMQDISTTAYMGNQQFHVINDTKTTPVNFGEGSHNFEIALQYAIDYDFDLRVQYSLSWSNGKSTDNVILNFANRDNIIYDQNYIYLADSVTAGSGKVTLITGVEFVDPTDTSYNGATLTITIADSNVKFYKVQTTYETSHPFVKGLLTFDSNKNVLGPKDPEDETGETLITPYTVSAHAWWEYKQNSTTSTSNAYVMMYNYRRNYEHGIAYPGAESAYKKPVAAADYDHEYTNTNSEKVTEHYSQYNVYGATWAGGNRAYAGTGMYIIAGSSAVTLEVQVAGIWRKPGEAELTSENNFQYNYTEDWSLEEYSSDNLWDIRSFTYYVKANSARYIDILNSIEITSARGDVDVNLSTDYRIVTNKIIVNDTTTFSYGEETNYDGFIQVKQLATSTASTKATISKEYPVNAVSVVNTTLYQNGLYDTYSNSVPASQRFNGNITLINNTASIQNVSVSLDLYYHISNGATKLYNDDNLRAGDLIDGTTYTYKSPFDSSSGISNLYYSYTTDTDNLYQVNNTTAKTTYTISLAPYASVNLISTYEVAEGLSSEVLTAFDDPTTNANATHNRNEYYDVWTYLVPTVNATAATSGNSNLTLETTQSTSGTTISVKNNTNKKITGITIDDLTLMTYTETDSTALTSQPYDWDASYWKYYLGDTQLTSKPSTFTSGVYKLKTKSYSIISTTNGTITNNYLSTDFTLNDKKQIVDSDSESKISLLPGESVEIASFSITAKVIVYGTVTVTTTEDLTDVEIINNGTKNAYIVNYSANAYYLRFNGTATGTNIELISGYNYYIGIVRPGQIINLSMTASATIATADKIVISEVYSESDLWNISAVRTRYTKFFNINANKTTETTTE